MTEDTMIVNVIIRARHVEVLVLFLVKVDTSVVFCLLYEPMLALHASMEIMVAPNQI